MHKSIHYSLTSAIVNVESISLHMAETAVDRGDVQEQIVTPWDVVASEKGVDYGKLIGTSTGYMQSRKTGRKLSSN